MSQAAPAPALAAVLLAAGQSARMGRPKMLLPWQGATIIGHLVSTWRTLGARQVGVVCRPADTALAAELDRLGVSSRDRIANPLADQGMFSSVQAAARWGGWRAELTHFALVLGDQPHLRPATLRRLLDDCAKNPAVARQPSFQHQPAHPVVLPRRLFHPLGDQPGASTLRDYLQTITVALTEITDPGLALDLDTPADYQAAISSAADSPESLTPFGGQADATKT